MSINNTGRVAIITMALLLILGCSISRKEPTPTAPPVTEAATQTASPVEITEVAQTEPPATQAPTATAEPEPPIPSTVVFGGTQGDLWSWREGFANILLEDSGDVIDAVLSPDGTKVVYTRSIDYINVSLHVINTDGSNKRELLSDGQLLALLWEPGHEKFQEQFAGVTFVGNMPAGITWLPDSEHILFTSSPRTEGPGSFVIADLYRLNTVSSELVLLTNDTNGGIPFPSPDGKYIAISQSERVNLVDADGSNLRTDLVTFPFVITYSEYLLYPKIVWQDDSGAFTILIPSEDPMAPEPGADVWRVQVPSGDVANVLTISNTRPFFWPELSRNGERVLYMREVGQPADNIADVYTASIADGQEILITGNLSGGIEFHPDSEQVIWYEYGPDLPKAYLIDTAGYVTLLCDSLQGNVAWLSPMEYVCYRDTGTEIELVKQTVGGFPTTLATMPVESPASILSLLYTPNH